MGEEELARLEAEADLALTAPATGYNSLYREWARRAKVLIHELRRERKKTGA